MSNKDETTPTPAAPTETEIGKDAVPAEDMAKAAEEQLIESENSTEDDTSTPNYYDHPDDGRGGDDE